MSTLTEVQSQIRFEKIEKIALKVSQARGLAIISILMFLLWVLLLWANYRLISFKKTIPSLNFDANDENEVADILELTDSIFSRSHKLFDYADQLSISQNEFPGNFLLLHKTNIKLLEEVACSLEDIAESLVLVSNKDFMDWVVKEFETVEEDHKGQERVKVHT